MFSFPQCRKDLHVKFSGHREEIIRLVTESSRVVFGSASHRPQKYPVKILKQFQKLFLRQIMLLLISVQLFFRLQIWQCSNRTLSLLIISCPGHTNHYLTPCFYPSLLLTLLSFSFSSPFITDNPCSFLHSCTQPISISLDGRLYT